MSALAGLLGPTTPVAGKKRPAPNYDGLVKSIEERLQNGLGRWKNAQTRQDIAYAMKELRGVVSSRNEVEGNAPAAFHAAVEKGVENLAYLCIQENLREEADKLLIELRYTHSLSDKVVRYKDSSIQNGSLADPNHSKVVQVFRNALPVKMLRQLQHAFRAESPFWSEHKYPCPYFSYAHALIPTGPPKHLMDQLSRMLLKNLTPVFPQLKGGVNFVEWWSHNRTHSHGHQLHFDSDNEGIGTVRNPICSAILYLTPSSIGGPTLVTTQELKSKALATHGWMVYPEENCIGVFDGKYLHGVIPGRGVPNDWKKGSTKPPSRRVTLMFAFWDSLNTKPCDPEYPGGASKQFPEENKTNYTWAKLLRPCAMEHDDGGEEEEEGRFITNHSFGENVPVEPIAPIWQPLKLKTPLAMDKDNDQAETNAAKLTKMPKYDDCFQFPC
jgi:hypothetical protein